MSKNPILLQSALDLFQSARKYTLSLVDGMTPEQWYWTPQPPASHIAWQVGHLAVAQYGLMLFRQRGRAEVDAELMSGEFRKLFMKGTNPQSDPTIYPRPDEIISVLNRVHDQALSEAANFDPSALDAATDPPHAGPPTRLGSLYFAGYHEMLHAGQIGLLRRLMGLNPIR
jgi:hypothetical protein